MYPIEQINPSDQPDDTEAFAAELEATHEPHEFEQAHQQRMADAVAKALTKLKDE